MQTKSGQERALIAVGPWEASIVIATDALWLAQELASFGNAAEPIFGAALPEAPGLYLWQGSFDGELEWTGTIRPVEGWELERLLAMAPPDEDVGDDDLESRVVEE